jgi:hypothetical protein
LDFPTVFFFTQQGHQPYVQLITWKTRSLCLWPLWQGGPVISPGTRFPLCCLLWLMRLWWRYSNTSPHRTDTDILKQCHLFVFLSCCNWH